jgi:hypothetical protein
MSDDPLVALRDLSQPEGTGRTGNLISASISWAELEVTDGGAPIAGGTLVELQTSQTIYLGRVESGEILDKNQRLRIRVDHWLDLQDVATIQELWSEQKSD